VGQRGAGSSNCGDAVGQLRLLLVAQPTTGGVGVAVAQLAEAAVRAGLATTVACPARGELPARVEEVHARWINLPLAREPTPADAQRLRELRALCRAADVVHLHSSKAGALGRLAVRSLGSARPACVFTPHAWSWLVGGLPARFYRGFESVAWRMVDQIVAVSEEAAVVGAPVLRAGAGRMVVIRNGVDTQRFSPDGPMAERGSEPLVVSVGRLEWEKGQDVLLRAFARIDLPSARLRLVGDGPMLPFLERLAGDLRIGHRIEFLGHSADPGSHYRAADVVVVPSRRDALSLVLLEAMACGAPVVATRVPGTAAAAGVARIVPPERPDALGAAVAELLDAPEARGALGEAARARVVSEYSLERSTAAHLDLWVRLARGGA
jgi:glycosyltransferase involved in cell wall biosynthesis